MEPSSVSVNCDLPMTHSFVYRGKQYPFNMVIFNMFSQYFNSNQQIQPNSIIELLSDKEDDVNIPSEVIQDFINYLQFCSIKLTKNNVPFFHKLAKKYIVPSLIKATEDFITAHSKEFVVEFLTMNSNQLNFNTKEYEEMIVNDFIEYIKDDKLLALPFPILYRIVNKYCLKYQKDDSKSEIPSEFIEFLFKCLDHFGRTASVLFANLEFGKTNVKVVYRLLNEYSEKFDFNFINPLLLKSICSTEGRIIEREESMKQELKLVKEENEKMKLNIIELN